MIYTETSSLYQKKKNIIFPSKNILKPHVTADSPFSYKTCLAHRNLWIFVNTLFT